MKIRFPIVFSILLGLAAAGSLNAQSKVKEIDVKDFTLPENIHIPILSIS